MVLLVKASRFSEDKMGAFPTCKPAFSLNFSSTTFKFIFKPNHFSLDWTETNYNV